MNKVRYILYLARWYWEHRKYTGMSPVCYDEWYYNERVEEQ